MGSSVYEVSGSLDYLSGPGECAALHKKVKLRVREAVSEPEAVATGSPVEEKAKNFTVNHRFRR